jgi:hypothetical protein
MAKAQSGNRKLSASWTGPLLDGIVLNIKVAPKKIIFLFVSIGAALIFANILCYVLKFIVNYPGIHRFAMINLDEEANVPTYFSSLLLLTSGCLLGIIAQAEKTKNSNFFRHWVFLSFLFFYMSLDEAAEIHEHLNGPIGELLNVGGIFYFAAVIPGILVTLLLLVFYLRFWMNLPQKSKILFMASAVFYIGGVIGVELAGGRYFNLHGPNNLTYGLLTVFEETLELAGIILFIYALLDYLRSCSNSIHLEFE